ncbi:TetR/AcrR family transcriptional regulator [Actinomadura nitritigenes]|uniref:TetR/AcrR family transcriptional regulator n=1 Tax=Actinomadura nitritigenes TaxID=134602 RepID=UPI003D9475FE
MSTVKPSRREMYAALTRTAVVETARELFGTAGYEATSIDDIARASQTSKGAVYHHFRDKQEIFAEVFQAGQERLIARALEAMPPATASAWERVEAATRAFLDAYVEDAEARFMLRQAMTVLGWDRVRELDERMALPLIRDTLTEAIEAGEARSVPVPVAADLLLGLYCNAVLVIAAGADPARAAREVQDVVSALLGGLRS